MQVKSKYRGYDIVLVHTKEGKQWSASKGGDTFLSGSFSKAMDIIDDKLKKL